MTVDRSEATPEKRTASVNPAAPSGITSSERTASARSGGASRWARTVGYVVNPLILPPLLFTVLAALFGAPPREIVGVALLALIFLTLVPTTSLVWMVRSGRAATLDISDRKARAMPFAAGLAGTAALALALGTFAQTARSFMLAVALLLLVNTAILAIVNLRWKISLHSAAVAGCASVLAYAVLLFGSGGPETAAAWGPTSWGSAAVAVALVPLVMWSRVSSLAHSAAEVWAGAGFGALVPPIELALLEAAGFLGQAPGTLA